MYLISTLDKLLDTFVIKTKESHNQPNAIKFDKNLTCFGGIIFAPIGNKKKLGMPRVKRAVWKDSFQYNTRGPFHILKKRNFLKKNVISMSKIMCLRK